MHQLHFTIQTAHEKGDSHDEIISSIRSYAQCNFSETTYWDYFEVLGYVNLQTNLIHWNERAWDMRFQSILTKPQDIELWSNYLGGLIKESISEQEKPEYENNSLFYFRIKEYIKFICSLRFLDSKLVSGPIDNVQIDYSSLPTKIQEYAGFFENQFDKFGVTNYGDSEDNSIIGLLDIHY